MFTQGLVALVAAAFARQTLAAVAPYNRNPLEKKDLKLVTVVTTEVKWVTVTEYEGQAPTAAPTFYTHSRKRKSKSSVVEAPASAPAPPAPAVPTTIITRTRASVAPAPSSSAAPAPAPPPAPPAPVPAPPVSSAVPPPPPPPSPAPAPPAAAPEPVAPPPAPPAAPPAPAPAPPAPKPAPPPPPPAAPPAPAPPAPKPIATGTKRGLPYNKPELLRSLVDSGSKVSWTYNWGQRDDSGLDIEFCPMLWGMKLDFAQTWPANAQRAIDAGSKCLLSFNEPDLGSQANMSPEEAARRHIELMNPFAGKALIGSPAVTNSGDANQGIQYLQKWVNACAGRCHFDFVVIHIYGFDTRTFLEHLRKVHNMFNKPIWITEFAFNGSEEEINRQLSEVLTTIDSEMPFVERLSYFMVENGMLVNGNSPTRYGNTFAYGA